ncbi:MAG: hypothetical protein ACRD1X_07440 [Vicinamibacteria bacterium]
MPTSLLETFATLDLSLRNALANISSPLLLALAALQVARSRAKVDGLTSEHVVACLEAAGGRGNEEIRGESAGSRRKPSGSWSQRRG